MEKEKRFNNYQTSNSKFKRIIAPILASLAITLPSTSAVKAYDMISPNPKNLITRPFYDFLEINLWHNVLYGNDKSAEGRLQIGLKRYLETKLSKKYPNINYDKLAQDLINLMLEVYRSKTDTTFQKFVDSYLKILSKNGISKDDGINLLLDLITEQVVPNDILSRINIDGMSQVVIDDLLSYYGKREFKEKINKLYLLYKQGQLDKDKIGEIFGDYIEYTRFASRLMIIVVILILVIGGGVMGWIIRDMKRNNFI